jgi:two-component system chemotaxis response regulator CheY
VAKADRRGCAGIPASARLARWQATGYLLVVGSFDDRSRPTSTEYRAGRNGGQFEEAEVQPRKILVVDDSKLIHKMFEVLLRQFSLVHAHDGLEALQCLGTHSEIDLVLLDINMPKMSGLEFLNQIKSDNVFKEIPVVIISTEGKEEDTIRGLEAGAAAYIKKPFGNQELLEVIQRL